MTRIVCPCCGGTGREQFMDHKNRYVTARCIKCGGAGVIFTPRPGEPK